MNQMLIKKILVFFLKDHRFVYPSALFSIFPTHASIQVPAAILHTRVWIIQGEFYQQTNKINVE